MAKVKRPFVKVKSVCAYGGFRGDPAEKPPQGTQLFYQEIIKVKCDPT